MAKFFGAIGYGENVEKPPNSGVWVDSITERGYYGTVLRNTRQLTGSDVNPDVTVSNQISIVADQYAVDSFVNIKYVRWAGKLWTVNDIEVRSPRLILSIGSLYNGPTA